MKKHLKWICIILCVVGLLCACGPEQNQEQQMATNLTTESTQPSVQMTQPEPTEPALEKEDPLATAPQFPEEYEVVAVEPQDMALVYPTDCDFEYVFDTIGSYDYLIQIFSKEPIDVNAVKADAIGTESETFLCSDNTDFSYETCNGNYMQNDYNAYLYQTQRGIDWKIAGELLEKSQNEPYSLEAGNAYSEYVSQYLDLYELEKKAYMDSCPYYYYRLNIYFEAPEMGATEPEIVEQIEVELEGQTYMLDIGQIRIQPLPDPTAPDSQSWGKGMRIPSSGGDMFLMPWNRGFFTNEISFEAEEDITLRQLKTTGQTSVVLGDIHIKCTKENNQSLDQTWDGSSAFYIDQGDSVSISFTCYDPRMAGRMVYFNAVRYALQYSLNDGDYTLISGTTIHTGDNLYDLCAQYLEGTDLSSYFIDYYNLLDSYIHQNQGKPG